MSDFQSLSYLPPECACTCRFCGPCIKCENFLWKKEIPHPPPPSPPTPPIHFYPFYLNVSFGVITKNLTYFLPNNLCHQKAGGDHLKWYVCYLLLCKLHIILKFIFLVNNRGLLSLSFSLHRYITTKVYHQFSPFLRITMTTIMIISCSFISSVHPHHQHIHIIQLRMCIQSRLTLAMENGINALCLFITRPVCKMHAHSSRWYELSLSLLQQ